MINSRETLRLIGLAIAVTILGLASRRFPVAGNYPGDALWATLVLILWTVCLPKAKLLTIFYLTIGTAFAVEFSQLYRSPWIDQLRANTFGRLVLGNGFDPIDLLAYVIGAAIGAFLVNALTPFRRS